MSDETSVVRTIGRYHTVAELGRGGMGIVYRGFDPVIGRTVALKTIGFVSEDAEARTLRERLYREASAAGTLTHPNIVTIYDVIEDGATTAVAMEFVEGQTLGALLSQQGALPLDRAIELFEQICAALDYAGSKGIVHRDIKPANILLTVDGRPKVTDFGIARMAVSGLTQTGTIMGSPSYMSPEQVRGLPLDPRSDLFSAAVVFYEMITGERAFGGDDVATTMYRIVNEPPKAAEMLNPTINPGVSLVLQRALAKNPADRYQTGGELIGELRRALGMSASGAYVGFAPMAAPVEAPAATRKSPLLRYGLIGLGVVVVAMVGLIVLGGRAGQPAGETSSQPAAASGQMPAGADTAAVSVPAIDAPQAQQPAPYPPFAAPPAASSYPGPVSTVPPAGAPYSGPVSTVPPPIGVTGDARSVGNPGQAGDRAGRADNPPTPARRASAAAPPERVPERDYRTSTQPISPRTDPGAPPAAVPALPPTPPPAAGDAVLRANYEGQPYAATIYSGDERVGRLDGADSALGIDPGTHRLRAVNEAMYLNADLGTVTVRGGERRTLSLPGSASAVFSVKGEDYAGVRVTIDGRQVPGPYPAQIARIASGPHRVTYRWGFGAAAGREITDTITVAAGGHFIVRAVPDNGQIVVQQLR